MQTVAAFAPSIDRLGRALIPMAKNVARAVPPDHIHASSSRSMRRGRPRWATAPALSAHGSRALHFLERAISFNGAARIFEDSRLVDVAVPASVARFGRCATHAKGVLRSWLVSAFSLIS
jgi:hypothetical protein